MRRKKNRCVAVLLAIVLSFFIPVCTGTEMESEQPDTVIDEITAEVPAEETLTESNLAETTFDDSIYIRYAS